MLHGRVLHPPAYGAELMSVDLAPAQALDGVTVVHEAGIVAVAAPDAPTVARALAAVQAEWSAPPQPSEPDLAQYLRAHPIYGVGSEAAQLDEQGDVDRALAAADVRLEQTYTTVYIAHASLEPRVALAEWDDGRLTVWTGTQQPYTVRRELALALAIPEPAVRVLVPDFGGGFGSKHTEEIAIAAAALARAAGRPVRVALTREEEFRFSYLRPAAVIDVSCGARRDGAITAWQFANINSGAAGLASPYTCEHRRVSFQPADFATAARPIPGTGCDRQPFRTGVPHRRARTRAGDRSTRVAAAQPHRRATRRRPARGGRARRLGPPTPGHR